MSLTVLILTFNEEPHIARAIESVQQWGLSDRVIVVDSGSTDRTCEIAASLGCEVVHHSFTTQAAQLQWALDTIDISSKWTMRLDADEYLLADSAQLLKEHLSTCSLDVEGILLPRYHVFMGRKILHGGRYPLHLLRIWRTGAAAVEQRIMDEHIAVKGRQQRLNAPFADENLRSLTEFTAKHNAYSTREAIQTLLGPRVQSSTLREGIPPQAARKSRVKEAIYDRLPLGAGPFFYFVWRYVFRLGFLDGRWGSVYHVLQGFWYRYLVDAKVAELRRLEGEVGTVQLLQDVERATGLDLSQFKTGDVHA